jgi:deoxyadenosine/deoxycytidine kinase
MRIIVVGPCASGKTSLVEKLVHLGYDADTIAQEHSQVPTLWQHNVPDVVIYLDVSFPSILKRREIDWDEAFLAEEKRRLANARQACDLCVNTDKLKEDQVFRRVRRFLEKRKLT